MLTVTDPHEPTEVVMDTWRLHLAIIVSAMLVSLAIHVLRYVVCQLKESCQDALYTRTLKRPHRFPRYTRHRSIKS